MHKRIAVFTNGFSNEFIEDIITGLQKNAEKDSVDIFVFVTYCSMMNHELQNKCQLNIFHLPDPADFDGAIMCTNTYNFPDEQERVCARFQRAGVPMLSLEVDVPNMSCIKTENYRGFHELAEHLVEVHNAKKIIYVNGVKGNVENSIRKQALLDVLSEHNLELYEEFNGDFGFYTSYEQMKIFLESGKELPDAVVCANDNMALGINTALSEKDLRAPEDMIITGFDMIRDGQCTFPILASVSRGWKAFGERVYEKIMYQIEHPDERFEETYDSFFVPAESCGCVPSKEALKNRFNIIRNQYFDNIQKDIMDIFFQRLSIPLSLATDKTDFFEKGVKKVRDIPLLGKNYCLCTEPEFFETDDEEYPDRIRGYSSNMDILYELRDGEKLSLQHFDSRELYPGYKHEEGKSNLYIFAPMNYLNYIIGYVAIKNAPGLLYNIDLSKFINNMNAQLFSMRRHIFSQRANNELKRIYMKDALTGMYNRTGCENVLYEYISELKEKGEKAILVFADIDRMKTINDQYGHLNGDIVLKRLGQIISKETTNEIKAYRYGGEEFIILVEKPVLPYIKAISQRIRRHMEEQEWEFNKDLVLTISIGCAIGSGEDDVVQKADDNLYISKTNGKNQVTM